MPHVFYRDNRKYGFNTGNRKIPVPTSGVHVFEIKLKILEHSHDQSYVQFGWPGYFDLKLSFSYSYQIRIFGNQYVTTPSNTVRYYITTIFKVTMDFDNLTCLFQVFTEEGELIAFASATINNPNLSVTQYGLTIPSESNKDTKLFFLFYYFKIDNYFNFDATLNNGVGNRIYCTINPSNYLEMTGAVPTDGSQWLYVSEEPRDEGLFRMGSGWSTLVRDFDHIPAFIASRKLKTNRHTVLCSGLITTNQWNSFPADSFPEGVLFKGVVEYDGTNHNDLAYLTGNNLAITLPSTVNAEFEDIHFKDVRTNSGWTFRGKKFKLLRCIFQRLYRVSDIIYDDNTTDVIESLIEKCVFVTNSPTTRAIVHHGYSGRTDVRNVTLPAGGIVQAVRGFVIDSFIPNGYVHIYDQNENYRQNNNATTLVDPPISTAAIPAYANYSTDEYVDYDNWDFRIKLTSPLHALGIGAFFEPAPEYTEELFAKVYLSDQFISGTLKVRQSNGWLPAAFKIRK